MLIYDSENFRKFDKKTREKIRIEEAKERAREKKKINTSYLKGQRGVRLYYDKEQLFDKQNQNIGIEEKSMQK